MIACEILAVSSRNGVRGLRSLRKFCVKRRDAKWEAFVPEPPASQESKVPLLAGAKLALEITAVGGWFERLIHTAYRSGAPKMSTLNGIQQKRLNTVDLFKFSLCQNGKWLQETAIDLGVDADALQAVDAPRANPFPASVQPPVGAFDCPRVGWKDIVPCAARGRPLPKCEGSSAAATCAAAAAVADGKRSVCLARTAA